MIRVLITGVTGMVGEGVLHECLQHTQIEYVLVINRKPCGVSHPKLQEIIHSDFNDLSSIENKLTNYDACFFCLGVSSIGMKEAEYYSLTHDLTIHIATTVFKLNPKMTFCYVSGVGTDSTEKGNSMWARVKGKTENHLMQIGFKHTFAFRPGYMHPTKGLKNTLNYYSYLSWLYPVFRFIFPKYVSTLKELGLAMINVVIKGYPKSVLEVNDIVKIAKG